MQTVVQNFEVLAGIFCLEEIVEGHWRQIKIACENNGGLGWQDRDSSFRLEPEDLEVGTKSQNAYMLREVLEEVFIWLDN